MDAMSEVVERTPSTKPADAAALPFEPLPALGGDADCVVIITDHARFDYNALVKEARLIVDTRNALKGFKSPNIVCL
jgi:UDP-N-acetyl-D-mannosaminuronate dehydrogenase